MFKHHSILIALTFLCTSSFSQAYLPLIEDEKMWSEYVYLYPDLQWTDFYFIGNDTIINDSLYYKLFYDSNNPYNSYDLKGYLRETDQGQVYYLETDKTGNLSVTEEYLLFDFNAQPGDTLDVYAGYGPGTYQIVIDSIVSKEYFNIIRNKYYYHLAEGALESNYFIEGLGSSQGLLHTCWINLDDGSWLLCVTKDTTFLYHNPNWSTCVVPNTVSIEEQFYDELLSISPNPNNGNFKLNFQQDRDFEFRLYNIYGVLLVKLNVTTNVVLDLSRYIGARGLYIYLILKDNQIVKKGEMIIN